MRDKPAAFIGRLTLLVLAAVILTSSCLEFYSVASGTGNWWADFSLKWALFFAAFDLFCLLALAALVLALWFPPTLTRLARPAIDLRKRLGTVLRWLAIVIILILPVWLFQYSLWGIVFRGPVRLVVWGVAAASTGFLLTRAEDCVADLTGSLKGVFLSGLAFILAIPFSGVTDYPFSLGWSEGNRLWDYSILFGRSRYIYPPEKDLAPFLDLSRQLVGGIPFLVPGLTIWQERFWLSLTNLLPYAFLGLLVFGVRRSGTGAGWILAGLWGLAFLRQGPIHTPLLICAMLTWLMWRRPLWLALPVIAATGYFASVSRFTWTFAPAIWIGMLELAGGETVGGRLTRSAWRRAILLGFAGLLGGYLLPALWRFIGDAAGGLSAETVIQGVTRQPLLWYRLLPNSTYSLGVFLGLLLAVCPLVILLVYLVHKKMWALNGWQKAAVVLPLLAFLVVGLVVSTKIGGGGDLHNLDMFLIGLLFAAGVAWVESNPQWTGGGRGVPAWMRLSLFLLVALPAFSALFTMRPLLFAEDVSRLQALTGIEDPRLIGLLPAREEIESSLDRIRAIVAEAQSRGEVLFMDQRQLLTFGYIQDVPLVAEYEKKYLMDHAMGNAAASVFDQFYRDLAAHRFTLIVSEPLHTPIQNEEYGFGEENNAWVKWVSRPLLCYYQPDVTLRELRVQLLVPKTEAVDCTDAVPPEADFQP
ncbi:MAG: hypothetical protein AB1564_11170 [Chloroflexota bacterium]